MHKNQSDLPNIIISDKDMAFYFNSIILITLLQDIKYT